MTDNLTHSAGITALQLQGQKQSLKVVSHVPLLSLMPFTQHSHCAESFQVKRAVSSPQRYTRCFTRSHAEPKNSLFLNLQRRK